MANRRLGWRARNTLQFGLPRALCPRWCPIFPGHELQPGTSTTPPSALSPSNCPKCHQMPLALMAPPHSSGWILLFLGVWSWSLPMGHPLSRLQNDLSDTKVGRPCPITCRDGGRLSALRTGCTRLSEGPRPCSYPLSSLSSQDGDACWLAAQALTHIHALLPRSCPPLPGMRWRGTRCRSPCRTQLKGTVLCVPPTHSVGRPSQRSDPLTALPLHRNHCLPSLPPEPPSQALLPSELCH